MGWEQIRVAVGAKVWQSLYQGKPPLDDGGVQPNECARYEQPMWIEQADGSCHVPGTERDGRELIQSWGLAFKGENTPDAVVGQFRLRLGNTAYLLD